MAPPDRFRMPRRHFHDQDTGREVWQVTDGPFECAAPYPEILASGPGDRFFFGVWLLSDAR